MSYKKVKVLLSFVICLFIAGVFSACSDSSGTLSFKQAELTMAINQEIDLETLVELKNCSIDGIEFISSNPEYVYIKSGHKLVSRAEGTSIITATGYNAILEVTVEGTTVKFAKPTNLAYDETLNAVVWDAVYAGDAVATTYQVKITKDGEEPIIAETYTNSYEVLGDGTYSVEVSCKDRADAGIQASDVSDVYRFSKLSAPFGLTYNDQTGILSWQSEDASSKFRVLVNGVASEVLTEKQYSLNLQEPKKYEISVMACADSSQNNVFGATSVDRLTLTRLKAPEVNITEGTITWSDLEQGASAFDLTVSGATVIKEKILKNSAGQYSYTLSGKDPGEYSIEMYALGDSEDVYYDASERYLNSAVSTTTGIRKLEKKQIYFDKTNNLIKVVDFDASLNYNLSLTITHNGLLKEVVKMANDGTYAPNLVESGIYEFTLSNLSQTNLQINGDISDKITVVRLAKATNPTHRITDGKYYVENFEISNATKYVIEIQQTIGGDSRFELTDSNNLVSDLFSSAGEYVVNIYASGTDSQGITYLDSITNTRLSVVRLQKCTPTDDSENKAIVWDNVSTIGNLRYGYELYSSTSELIDGGLLESNRFSYAGLGVGSYTLNVWATTTAVEGEQTIILDSLGKSSVDFSVHKTLETPTLDWQRVENGEDVKYIISIFNVEGATSYIVNCNGATVGEVLRTDGEKSTFDATACFNANGVGNNQCEYEFEVIAKNTENIYYYDSQKAGLKAIKASAPATFELAVINNNELEIKETISSGITANWYSGSEIIINNIKTNELSAEGLFEATEYYVKIKYLSNNNKVGDAYYVDSDYAEFKLTKISNNIDISGKKLTWNVQETTQRVVNRLVISQGENKEIIQITNETEYDLASLPKAFNLDSPIHVAFQTVVSAFNGNISGEYVDGRFLSGTLLDEQRELTNYYVSSNANIINAQNANAEIGIAITEVGEQVNITWNSKENAQYKINNLGVYSFASSEFRPSTVNYLNLEEIIGTIRTAYLFTIKRIANVSSIKVEKDEKISAINMPTEVEKLVCSVNGEEVFDLTNITSSLGTTLSAHYLAKQNNGANYYLNSYINNFIFKRLQSLDVSNNLNIYNNIISWNIEETALANEYKYSVTFYDDSASGEEHNVVLNVQTTNNIDLTTKQFADIIYSLTGTKYIKIQKVVDEFDASFSKDNYLTSDIMIKELKILNTPLNVKIEAKADDKTQSDLKITWDINGEGELEPSKYNIKISNKYTETVVTSTGYYTLTATDVFFKEAGEWRVEVQAVGVGEVISSKYSTIATIVRLQKTSGVSVNKSGLVEWSKVENASGYILQYSYTNNEGTLIEKEKTFNGDVFSYQIEYAELNSLFSGNISVKLYAVGNGVSTSENGEIGYLSSVKDETFTRVVAPQIELSSTKMTFVNFADYKKGEKIYVKAVISTKQVLNLEIIPTLDEQNNYVWVYPKTYSYYQDGKLVEVDFTTSKDIAFTISATCNMPNTIDSNVVLKTANILADITDLKFKRDSEGVVHFYATNPNTTSTRIQATIGTEVFEADGSIDIAFTEELLGKISNNWTISVKALGKEGAIVYIESNITQISGTKLTNNSTITTSSNNLNVIWSEIPNARDYRLKYYDAETPANITYKENYSAKREEVIGSSYTAGVYKFAVKAIGNVTSDYLDNDIVLDGDYTAEVIISKLNKIQNIEIKSGFISFEEVLDADGYMAVLYSNLQTAPIDEYPLEKYTLPTGETGNYYYSQRLMDKISDGNEYYVKFYALAVKAQYICSDVADIVAENGTDNYIIIKTFAQGDNEITLSHPNIDEGNFDYSITIATLKLNAGITDGLLLSIDNQVQYTTENVLILDAEGKWDAGEHNISYAQLGSSVIDTERKAYLTSFGKTTTVTKLGSSELYVVFANNETEELGVSFKEVENTDAYYCYVGSTEIYDIYGRNVNLIDFTRLIEGDYSYVAIKPISKNINFIAGNKAYLLDPTDSNKTMIITKLTPPEIMDVKDGSMGWIPDILTELWPLHVGSVIRTPFFTSKDLIENQKIKIKFTNKETQISTEFIDDAYRYIYITDELIDLAKVFPNYADLANKMEEARLKGFPCLNYGFLDYCKNLAGGEYDIQVKILGNTEVTYSEGEQAVLITSAYNKAITKYISNAPNIRIENNNDIYNLKFTNVTVNSSYFNSSEGNLPTYNIIGIYHNGDTEVREVITQITASGINNSEEIVVNLTQLVAEGKLTSKFTEIYVSMAGNDSMGVLNGRCSNRIKVIVLEEIKAKVEHGIIKWNAMEHATKYVITYGTSVLNKIYQEGKTVYSWECEELVANQPYDVTIMAYGTQEKNASANGVVVISGKIADVGTIIKLSGISNVKNGIDIDGGIYGWSAIENATAYDVFILDSEVADGNYGNYLTIPTNSYETTANNLVNYYYFRAVGTESQNLSPDSLVYVNSSISAENIGIRNTEVTDLKFINGILSWKYTNASASFRLTFNRLQGGEEESVVIYTTYTQSVKNGVCYLNTNDYEALKNYGNYVVKIQAFYETKTETNTNTGIFYLISAPKILDFHKLDTVSDIKVEKGIITWNYSGVDTIDYHFRLHFSYYNEATSRTVEEIKYVAGGLNSFEGIIFEDDISMYAITLVIYVAPGKILQETTISYAESVPYVYESTLHQFDRVSEESISISITDNGQLLIDWYGPDDQNNEVASYKYEICYYTDKDAEERFITTEKSQILCGDGLDISFDIDGEYALILKIRIIPIIDNYISSAWTEPQQIEKPSKVTGLTYNQENFSFVWDKYQIGEELASSFYYKIKDEVGYMEGETFIVESVNIFNANIGDEVFTPFIIGTHRVSVAVIIKNSTSDGLMSDYCDAVVAEINLFASGIGTFQNPYIIETAEQFGNMRYRLHKDVKNNSYYECDFVDGKLVVAETLTNMDSTNTIYHFKQAQHLVITKENAIVNYEEEEDIEFNGSYNGDYYSLKLVWNENIAQASRLTNITIFKKLGARATVANINLLFDIDNAITINKYIVISLLAYENNGTIQNIVVGKNDEREISLSNLTNNFELTFIAYNNNKTIQNVENNYNINITTVNNNATISYGAIAINNKASGSIISARNNGNINVNASMAHIGGVVLAMDGNSIMQESANRGNIQVFLKARTNQPSIIGGLAGKVVRAKISYSYSVCDISIASASSIEPNANIGGLIGQAEGDNIRYSYTNITKNNNLIEGYTKYSTIYQVIGDLTSVSGAGKNVYYRVQENFGPVYTTGSVGEMFVGYETDTPVNEAGLFETDSKFSTDLLYNGNPTLKWEATFKNLTWKE